MDTLESKPSQTNESDQATEYENVQPPSDVPPRSPASDSPPESFGSWFQQNNPLYLLSVLFMFAGLFLASRASHEGASLTTVVGFFGIQNVYELIMLAMGLYLLKQKVNRRHGKILFAFILLFLGDVTFYQYRISAMCSTLDSTHVSFMVSGLYLFMALAKILVAVKVLDISLRWEHLFYPVFAFGLIYFAPQFFLSTVYNLKDLDILKNEQYPQWVIFEIWLAAALIQLPVIISGWWKSTFEEPVANRYLSDENHFYVPLVCFPFVVLPLQLGINVMTDDHLRTIPSLPNLIPYAFGAIFFIQIFVRKHIESAFGVNRFDFFCLLSLGLVMQFGTKASDSVYSEYSSVIFYVNAGLLVIACLATAVTRKNVWTAGLLGAMVAWYAMKEIMDAGKKTYDYVKELSLVTWAGVCMGASFLLLAVGFLFSVKNPQNPKSDTR